MKKTKKRITKLTAAEDKAWVKYFTYWLDAGKTELQADWLAWVNVRSEFKRLRAYDGCR